MKYVLVEQGMDLIGSWDMYYNPARDKYFFVYV
jgi:hypothetical protein